MLTKLTEVAVTFKNNIQSRFSDNSEEVEVKEAFKEQKVALYFLIVSSILFLIKLSGPLAEAGQWSTVLTAAQDRSAIAVFAVWTFLLSLEWIAKPILSGLAMAVITWYTVYLDSYIPGAFPPTPLSPQKTRLHARTFHMGYYLAAINGVILATVMLHANLTHPS